MSHRLIYFSPHGLEVFHSEAAVCKPFSHETPDLEWGSSVLGYNVHYGSLEYWDMMVCASWGIMVRGALMGQNGKEQPFPPHSPPKFPK